MKHQMVSINGMEVEKVEYRNQPVVTLRMIDELHQRPEGTARKSFHRNQDRFEDGYHFFDVPFEEWSRMIAVPLTDGDPDNAGRLTTGDPGPKQRNPMKFFTQAGYLLLVKPFTDDLAWKVQDCLIRDYFRLRQEYASNGEKLGGYRQKTQTRLDAAENQTRKVTRTFNTFLKTIKMMGLSGMKAVEMANQATIKNIGVDYIEMMGMEEIVQKEKEACRERDPSGKDLFLSILKHHVGVPDKDGIVEFRSVRELLSKDGLYKAHSKRLGRLGIKLNGKKGVFICPAIAKKRMFAEGEMLDSEAVRNLLLEIPGSKSKQLRLNGSPMRGVLVPWEGAQK